VIKVKRSALLAKSLLVCPYGVFENSLLGAQRQAFWRCFAARAVIDLVANSLKLQNCSRPTGSNVPDFFAACFKKGKWGPVLEKSNADANVPTGWEMER